MATDPFAFTGRPWIVAKHGDGVVASGKIREYRPIASMTAEQHEAEDLKHYGGHLVAESVPVVLQPVVAMAPDALEVALLVNRLLLAAGDGPCPFCGGAQASGRFHVDPCPGWISVRVVERLGQESEAALEAATAADERLREALGVLRQYLVQQEARS